MTPPSRWTLRTKLLASVLALFTVVMLATRDLELRSLAFDPLALGFPALDLLDDEVIEHSHVRF